MRYLLLLFTLACAGMATSAEYPDPVRAQRNLELLVTGEKKIDQFDAKERVEMRVYIQKIRAPKAPWVDFEKLPQDAPKPPPPQVVELGPIDKWRFESCMQEATKNPTEAGVRVAVYGCKKKFEQP